jgi:hypothetical protein
LKTFGARYKKGQAAIAEDTNGFGKTLKSLEVKASNVELLKLLSRIRHEFW